MGDMMLQLQRSHCLSNRFNNITIPILHVHTLQWRYVDPYYNVGALDRIPQCSCHKVHVGDGGQYRGGSGIDGQCYPACKCPRLRDSLGVVHDDWHILLLG